MITNILITWLTDQYSYNNMYPVRPIFIDFDIFTILNSSHNNYKTISKIDKILKNKKMYLFWNGFW